MVPIALLLLGNGPASESYETVIVSQLGNPDFGDDGTLAVTSYDVIMYVPPSGQVYELTMPAEMRKHVSAYVVAVGRGIWLRLDDRFAYASLARVGSAPGKRVELDWQLAKIPEHVGDTDAIVSDGDAQLRVGGGRSTPWLLTASPPGHEELGIRVERSRGHLRWPPYVARRTEVMVHADGCDVVTKPLPDGTGARIRRLDTFTSEPSDSLCVVSVANERGRLWLSNGRALIAESGDSWFVLKSERDSAEHDPRMIDDYKPVPFRHRLRYPHPFRWLRRDGLPVVGVLLLGAGLTAGSFVTEDQAHHHGLVRTLNAAILAQPMAAAFNSGAIVSTSGRGGGALRKALIGVGMVLSPLPALGAWAGGRMTDDHAAQPRQGFCAAYIGAAFGSAVAVSISAMALRDRDSGASWWFAQLASAALIGFGASLGYSLGAELPEAQR